MNIEDIKKISAPSIEKLSCAINCAMQDLKEELGEDRLRSDMYVYLLQFSTIVDQVYFANEKKKMNIN